MAAFENQFSSFVGVACFVGFNDVEFFSYAKIASFGNVVVGTCSRDETQSQKKLCLID